MALKFELSVDEVNLVLAGLGKLPLEMSVPVWAKIKKAAEDQMKDQNAPTAEAGS